MRKKKVLGLMLSFTLAFGLALPATMAMPLESKVKASDSNATETDSNAVETDSNAVETDSNATEKIIEHLATCLEGCAGEDCECVCHISSLFERIMATETIEEFEQVVESATIEEMYTLSEIQIEEINVHIKEIEPEPLPEIIIEDPAYETIRSEVSYPIVSFTEVAPLGDPVIGE